jgi:hypothetical protein
MGWSYAMTSPAAKLRIHGKIPHVETVTRSYGMMVRDAILARLKTSPFFQGYTFYKSHALQIQHDDFPACAVFFMGEQLSQDGNNNTGEVRFSSEVKIGLSVYLINNDPEAMEDRLDNAYEALFQRLLRDPTLMNNEYFQIEAYTKGSRMHVYGQMGSPQSNETPYAEMRADLTCDLGAIEYEPRVEYMLEKIHIETVHPPSDIGENQVQHIYSEYDMDQDHGEEQ